MNPLPLSAPPDGQRHGARLFPLGETAIVLESQPETDAERGNVLQRQQKLQGIARHLRRNRFLQEQAIIDVVLGNQNLTVIFDPFVASVEQIEILLQTLWEQYLPDTTTRQQNKLIELTVHYGGKFGPDLLSVAKYHNLKEDDVIQIHSAITYTVLFIGFQPGFAYFHGLDPAIATPRLCTPRSKIPAGAIGIGGTQTGIYPNSSPGGWQIIGRYSGKQGALFDYQRQQPCLLNEGDRVRFIPC